MTQLRKLVKAKLKSAFSISRKSPKGSPNDLGSKLDVGEEYKEAFRTKSYEDILSKVHQEKARMDDHRNDRLSSMASSSSLTLYHDIHLADHLSEPQGDNDALREAAQSHHLIGDYIDTTLEACDICDLLLRCIQQMRSDHRKFERVFRLAKRVLESGDNSANVWEAIYRELAKCATQRTSLSSLGGMQFRDLHSSNLDLLDKMTLETEKIRKRLKLKKTRKRVGLGVYCLVVSHAALVSTALLVIALHGVVGVLAAPGLVACCVYLFRKRRKSVRGSQLPINSDSLDRVHRQLEVASKGTYILINDFDTMGVIVRRSYDEVEHWKALANMCVKSRSADLFKEVVKEFYLHNSCYLEQLEELERHAYLCFNTIDRSRKLMMEEIIKTTEAPAH